MVADISSITTLTSMDYADLLEIAASQLYKDQILEAAWWEEEILFVGTSYPPGP